MARSKDKSGAPTDWSRISTAISTILTAILVLGLVAGLTAGLGPLEARAASVLGVKGPTVTIAWPTYEAKDGTKVSWLGDSFQEQILDRAQAALDPTGAPTEVFKRDALVAVGESLRTCGWFEGTPLVTRREGGEIHVEGTWRIPAAVVREGSADRLISRNAMPMPVEYPAAELGKTRGQTVILGVSAQAPLDGSGLPDYTAPWPGEDLRAGLELLDLLSRQAWREQIVAIDVTGFNETKQLSLVTRRHGRVDWGGRPSAPRLGEISTAAKIAHLDQFNRECGSIDAKRDRVEIWGVQPLEINVSASGSKP